MPTTKGYSRSAKTAMATGSKTTAGKSTAPVIPRQSPTAEHNRVSLMTRGSKNNMAFNASTRYVNTERGIIRTTPPARGKQRRDARHKRTTTPAPLETFGAPNRRKGSRAWDRRQERIRSWIKSQTKQEK